MTANLVCLLGVLAGLNVDGDVAAAAPGSGAGGGAERLFEEGRRLYEAGDYAQAVARFEAAYQLFPAPIIVFDIAQAHRLRGDCAGARRAYARFRQLAPDAPERELADEHHDALVARCPGPAAPTASSSVPTCPRAVASPPLAPPRGPRWVRFVALAVGLAAGLAAAAVELRGRDAFARWRAEDGLLAMGAPGGDRRALDGWVDRQRANDALAGHIRRTRSASVALAAVGAGGLVGGTVLAFPVAIPW
jgi:hypothetical protein